jgi:hypothetical protein
MMTTAVVFTAAEQKPALGESSISTPAQKKTGFLRSAQLGSIESFIQFRKFDQNERGTVFGASLSYGDPLIAGGSLSTPNISSIFGTSSTPPPKLLGGTRQIKSRIFAPKTMGETGGSPLPAPPDLFTITSLGVRL